MSPSLTKQTISANSSLVYKPTGAVGEWTGPGAAVTPIPAAGAKSSGFQSRSFASISRPS
jgi:hypothetical protein